MAGPAQTVIELFEKRFRSTPRVYRAPGRVNLIGEHTDYNQGFVLPIAINLATYVAAAPNGDGMLRVFSANRNEAREWPLASLEDLSAAGDWSDYVIGVARRIPPASGMDLAIHSTVPTGSGLSSSAALEVSVALALSADHAWDGPLRKRELAKLARSAENEFVGVPCGIMDQFASVFGEQNAAIKIDCRSLEYEIAPVSEKVSIVAVNTMVRHELGQSAYRERVEQCAAAVWAIRAGSGRKVESLRDASEEDLRFISDPVARRRARHIVTENCRVDRFVAALRKGNFAAGGRLFQESHHSLKKDFEVSCLELDFLVDVAVPVEGVYGARMTGGGFGGCTVNLIAPEAVKFFEQTVGEAYRKRFGIVPEFYCVQPSAGAGKISSR